MIDFIIAEHPDMISEISKEELLNKFKGKVDLDLINYMIDNQEDVEVTYNKNENIYRFDNVSISDLIFNLNNKDNSLSFMENFKDSFKVNLDIDLNNNTLKIFNMVERIEFTFDLDIPESSKLQQVKQFKSMQSSIKSIGFILDDKDELPRLSLLCNDLVSLTLANLTKALMIAESYTPSYECEF